MIGHNFLRVFSQSKNFSGACGASQWGGGGAQPHPPTPLEPPPPLGKTLLAAPAPASLRPLAPCPVVSPLSLLVWLPCPALLCCPSPSAPPPPPHHHHPNSLLQDGDTTNDMDVDDGGLVRGPCAHVLCEGTGYRVDTGGGHPSNFKGLGRTARDARQRWGRGRGAARAVLLQL